MLSIIYIFKFYFHFETFFFFEGALPKAYPDNHLSQVDVNELFSKLLKTGILKLSQPDSATTRKYVFILHLHKAPLSYKDV